MLDDAIAPSRSDASVRVRESADQLERHIRACGLKPGDRYMTTQEAGKLLGKSLVVAQRAMALLAQRKILERRPKAGTFIGEAMATRVNITHIHFMLPEQTQVETETQENHWAQIEEMRSILGTISVHFHFIPNQNLDYTRQIVERASKAELLNGVVLVLPSREMRSYFNHSGIPTVVEGGVEPDLTNLCWIQWNQTQVGRLLAGHLLELGHRRIATIMREVWSMGEPLLHEGINDAITAANLPSNTLRIRSVPNEQAAIFEIARKLLQEENPVTGFICRTEFQADCVAQAAKSLKLEKHVEITLCNPPAKPGRRYTGTVPKADSPGLGKIVGSMFADLLKNQAPEQRGHEIAVELQVRPR